ncbi:alpha-galactosidase [Clostridium puniceum]|uniref:Alpha-galactosidase n=1 Tax=Clostridium puniceum TaxID=29367 RepID=A0A1S8TWY9_9CLOT|nr:alpha-galactosidase [Clostridium puniceum]OOM82268.1 alpha-galactosidase [Clostridium puniceum]
MPIIFEKNSKIFHIKSEKTSYALKVLKTGHVAHLYWGRKLNSNSLSYIIDKRKRASYISNTDNIKEFKLELVPQEYPSYGNTDLRVPAFELQFEDGSTTTNLRYAHYKIYKGKKALNGLPATYVESNNEATTLEIHLIDELKKIKVILTYSVFENFDAITRSVELINEGKEEVRILRALSANVDFNSDKFEMLHLGGAWARERCIIRNKITQGSQSTESRRGASGHGTNPFISLVRKETTETNGDVYAVNLVYSGNYLGNIEVDMHSNTRVQIGINPFDFNWVLEPEEGFQTPEAVMVYSPNGITGMSHIYQNLYKNRLCRGKYRDVVRPILINNWEATYFDFNERKIKEIAKEASELGIELFVLDDGWFGNRNDDTSSLGDWFVNEKKLKSGLTSLASEINKMGLKFGLWFEPEMISPNSELYKEHDDWCIHVPGRLKSEARNQLVLDLSRKEVCDYVIEAVSNVLNLASISYVKWDMNRNMMDIGSKGLPAKRQRETAHRYMLGLYRILEEIITRFPDVLFESCAGGGGRFDPGMLYYMPQTWTSDDTDAIERLKIQFGTSLVYPTVSIGCHVSEIPNHQVGRNTPIETRGVVAMTGNFGYELDVTKLSKEVKNIIKEQIKLYKEIRETVQFGDFYRLLSPFEDSEAAWMSISRDKSEAIVSYVKQYVEPNKEDKPLKLVGLECDAQYEILGEDIILGGDELMYVGLYIPVLKGDYTSKQWVLKKISICEK